MEVDEQRVVAHILDTEGFAHAICTITGFISFALQTMGKSIDKTTIHGWALDKPHSKEGSAEFIWR
jgi:hypothetical protein